MRLGTLRDGSRDGTLIVVDRNGVRFSRAGFVKTLQLALDDWPRCEPELRRVAEALDSQKSAGEPLDRSKLSAPLPRAYEWIDGSSYLNHILLVRKARRAEPPENLETEPLVYQGGSGVLLGPTQPLDWGGSDLGLDFEAEVAVILSDVPRGTTAADGSKYVRLFMLANDVTYRNLVTSELKKGFGFFVSKPPTAFAPFAVTTDELGVAFAKGRAFLRLVCTLNGHVMGDIETGPEMHFSFFDLLAHVASTRPLTAGTILGSGTVSNRDPSRGVSCIVERRTRETLDGMPLTPYMKPGDTVRIEAFDADGRSVFGAIEQKVVAR
jgi:fumarylacetoacetate (FAA) hydrolase